MLCYLQEASRKYVLSYNRELYMKTGQGFLLVFSITSQSSLLELQELREQIVRIKDDDNVPIVIVGNKSDLEEDRVVSRAKAFAMSQSWGNAPYYETSARRRGESQNLLFVSSYRLLLVLTLPSKRRRGLHRPLQTNHSKGQLGPAHARGGAGARSKA